MISGDPLRKPRWQEPTLALAAAARPRVLRRTVAGHDILWQCRRSLSEISSALTTNSAAGPPEPHEAVGATPQNSAVGQLRWRYSVGSWCCPQREQGHIQVVAAVPGFSDHCLQRLDRSFRESIRLGVVWGNRLIGNFPVL